MQRNIKKLRTPVNGVQYITSAEMREELKPIVFFDSGGSLMRNPELLIDFHPHSGVGIITYIPNSELHHRDTGGNGGVVPEGGAQWMLTGGGMWHREAYRPAGGGATEKPWKMFIHQLWVQLPPDAEEVDVEYTAIHPTDMPRYENVKVLSGEYQGIRGGIKTPLNLSYLDVHLEAGESWEFQAPAGQTRGFVYPRGNAVTVGATIVPVGNLGILEENEGVITVQANEATDFVVILAEPSPHDIIASRGSMHTNHAALERSRARIAELGRPLARL